MRLTWGWHSFFWGWQVSIWRLTIIFWGWQIFFLRLTIIFWSWHVSIRRLTHISIWANWRLTWGWHSLFEADMRLTIIFWGWQVSIWRLTIIFWDWHEADIHFLRLAWGWQSSSGADMSQSRGWHTFQSEPTGGWQLFSEADMELTSTFWDWHEADMFQPGGWQSSSEADIFQSGGWHGADIHVLRLTHFTLNQLEADNFFLFWGWHISIWTNLEANNSFSKSKPFQSGPSERLSILTAQFDLSQFFSSLNLTISFFLFPSWTTLFLNQLQSVSIWILVVFLQTVSNWLDSNHRPVWNPAILVSEFQGFPGRFYQILIAFIICMIHLDTLTMIRPMEAPFLMTSMSHNHHYQIWRHQFQPRYRGSCQNAI